MKEVHPFELVGKKDCWFGGNTTVPVTPTNIKSRAYLSKWAF